MKRPSYHCLWRKSFSFLFVIIPYKFIRNFLGPWVKKKMPLFALWNGLKIVRTSLHIALCQLRQVLWISLRHQFAVPELHSVLSNVWLSSTCGADNILTPETVAAYSQSRLPGAALTAFIRSLFVFLRVQEGTYTAAGMTECPDTWRPKVHPDNLECRALWRGHCGMLARPALLANPETPE